MFDFEIHSPEEEIHLPILKDNNVRLFIKRDDLIHPFISGNKWRKLKYNLIEAEKQGKKHLVSFGGAYSNHILALAAAGAKFGFKTTGFIRGEEIYNPMLSLCKIFGMSLCFVNREAYKHKIKLYNDIFTEETDTYFIDEGGAGKLAEKGCREIIKELKRAYNYIFCAAGTGTTASGIINEIALKNLETEINIVCVLKGYESISEDINLLLDKPYRYNILHDYHFGGYAKTKPKLIEFIQYVSKHTGMLTDPIYTGKTLFAIIDQVKQGKIKPNSKIIMIHTGGVFGILGMLDKFNKKGS
ncbi:Pyridoxal-5'-phosphate-dependent protein beta subunit [Pseudopedobacter saltans DSM 12145]|uniref:Pyridoxal-5'-phosphate-dependent protein beta subunit n=1 Tax=Pseudopedobacter saltans (strain ATCC 51119 / DSM 12145 / JCM 21818 / CCUG 39354 / LMG 10337 / NBRC 100064 / NCIMB 13643) TaxID=762903 RepID=F0SB36_PSESL|nr:pyridoxal-phosphate dependent enzyme [Pseudopedobacter saltans]ADY52671.1 Pyridoxal-5'-phosphate-dependent protein beta subunit [Pseudopedobacter saltans DSM 12145]